MLNIEKTIEKENTAENKTTAKLAVEIKNVVKNFGNVKVIKDVSLYINEGEIGIKGIINSLEFTD